MTLSAAELTAWWGLVKLTYDPLKEFAAVASTGVFNLILVVNPALPVKTAAELLAYGKANPGKLSYAEGSAGSLVVAKTFARKAGVSSSTNMIGTRPAMTSVRADGDCRQVGVLRAASLVGDCERPQIACLHEAAG